MSLLGILFYVAWVAVASIAGLIGYLLGGWNGSILGGVVGGVAFIPIVWLSYKLLPAWGSRELPACKSGRCNSKQYVQVPGEYFPQYKCRCGTLFIMTGDRFLEVLPSGQIQEYLRWDRAQGWIVDKGSITES